MRKYLLVMTMVLVFGTVVTGCGNKETDTEEVTATETPAAEDEGTGSTAEDTAEVAEAPVAPSFDDVDLSEIVKLPQYKGMDLEKIVTTVTKEAVDAEIKSALENAPVEDEDGVVEDGDIANIDYEGKVDDVAFDGGTDQGHDLRIGSGAFIPGFEEQLIGMKKGDTKDIDITFPEQYNEELAGKDAVFTVTINNISKVLDVPTDAWVEENTEYSNVAEYEESVEKAITEYNEETAEKELATQALTKLFDDAEIIEYLQEAVDYGEQLYEQGVQQYADYSGQTIEEFVESQGMTMEQYNEDKEENAKGIAKQVLVLNATVQAEGIKVGDDAYNAMLAVIVEEMQMSEEELIEAYGQGDVEQNILVRCIQDVILENANITEVEGSIDDIDGEEIELTEEMLQEMMEGEEIEFDEEFDEEADEEDDADHEEE